MRPGEGLGTGCSRSSAGLTCNLVLRRGNEREGHCSSDGDRRIPTADEYVFCMDEAGFNKDRVEVYGLGVYGGRCGRPRRALNGIRRPRSTGRTPALGRRRVALFHPEQSQSSRDGGPGRALRVRSLSRSCADRGGRERGSGRERVDRLTPGASARGSPGPSDCSDTASTANRTWMSRNSFTG